VVTVCGHANETCPVLPPEVKRLHWPLEDPAAAQGTDAEKLARFQEIRDQIEARIVVLESRGMDERCSRSLFSSWGPGTMTLADRGRSA
jgi:arsenate reductase